MKKLLITVLTLIFASSVAWSQNSNSKPSKTRASNTRSSNTKPVAVDCSKTSDAQITESVRAKLVGTASLKEETINVATSDGVVTLTGKVKGNHKGLASLQSKRVSCVKKVDNQLTIEKPPATEPKAKSKKTANKNT
jgi:osmotically-inducible protein OsmY